MDQSDLSSQSPDYRLKRVKFSGIGVLSLILLYILIYEKNGLL